MACTPFFLCCPSELFYEACDWVAKQGGGTSFSALLTTWDLAYDPKHDAYPTRSTSYVDYYAQAQVDAVRRLIGEIP